MTLEERLDLIRGRAREDIGETVLERALESEVHQVAPNPLPEETSQRVERADLAACMRGVRDQGARAGQVTPLDKDIRPI